MSAAAEGVQERSIQQSSSPTGAVVAAPPSGSESRRLSPLQPELASIREEGSPPPQSMDVDAATEVCYDYVCLRVELMAFILGTFKSRWRVSTPIHLYA